MKQVLNNIVVRRVSDLLLSPITLLSAVWFKYIRSTTRQQMPLSEQIFMKVGVLPVNDHYYQPLVNPSKTLTRELGEKRNLKGIQWNINEQLDLLNHFQFVEELSLLPRDRKDAAEHQYYLNNPSFLAGDGDYCYNIIRHFKPGMIIEIGCGYSTLICMQAEKKNEQTGSAPAKHICVEPYEMPWLEKLPVEVIRKKVEDIDVGFFSTLEANDILFIDSSHMIRPQGDVLFEFLEILPVLKQGVLVHIHDIFTPRDYPKEWVIDKHCLWNEQYLLEAFLSFNQQFRILGAVNFLKHNHPKELGAKCPNTAKIPDDEPGSFWMIRN
ncbi:MAG: class I SAM-dependent methyltransferase [Chitinophagaceae bacterium]|nr:class I SAM-dependent methyltransferase [Chitinophagaceae bacterium]